MSILCVGSVALDSVETPFGNADRVLGGSAVYFSAAATVFNPVQMVGVVGDDYPVDDLEFLANRGADLSGIERASGDSFFWAGRYHYDLNTRDTLDTQLGVFADFEPKIPEQFRDARFVFLGNIDPVLQHDVLDQVAAPEVVACDTMNFWIDGAREPLLELLGRVRILMVNDEEVRQLADEPNLLKAARWVQEQGPELVVVKKGEHGFSTCPAIRSKKSSIPREPETRSREASWGTWPVPVKSRRPRFAGLWCTAPRSAPSRASGSASSG